MVWYEVTFPRPVSRIQLLCTNPLSSIETPNSHSDPKLQKKINKSSVMSSGIQIKTVPHYLPAWMDGWLDASFVGFSNNSRIYESATQCLPREMVICSTTPVYKRQISLSSSGILVLRIHEEKEEDVILSDLIHNTSLASVRSEFHG